MIFSHFRLTNQRPYIIFQKKMEFKLPGVPPTSMASMNGGGSDESFLGALTSTDHGAPPGAFHPGFLHGPPGGPPMG